jgi:hypothetical protein
MKTIENYTIIKNTEKATLFRCFISEVNEETEFWMQKSKYEEKENTLHIEDDVWEKKLEELKQPKVIPAIVIYVENAEELEKTWKLILSAELKKIALSPWLFVPKSLILEIAEKEEKIIFKVPQWFWEKSLSQLIKDQLEFFNKDRDSDFFEKEDFNLKNKIEEG